MAWGKSRLAVMQEIRGHNLVKNAAEHQTSEVSSSRQTVLAFSRHSSPCFALIRQHGQSELQNTASRLYKVFRCCHSNLSMTMSYRRRHQGCIKVFRCCHPKPLYDDEPQNTASRLYKVFRCCHPKPLYDDELQKTASMLHKDFRCCHALSLCDDRHRYREVGVITTKRCMHP